MPERIDATLEADVVNAYSGGESGKAVAHGDSFSEMLAMGEWNSEVVRVFQGLRMILINPATLSPMIASCIIIIFCGRGDPLVPCFSGLINLCPNRPYSLTSFTVDIADLVRGMVKQDSFASTERASFHLGISLVIFVSPHSSHLYPYLRGSE